MFCAAYSTCVPSRSPACSTRCRKVPSPAFQNRVQPQRIGNRQSIAASLRRRIGVKHHVEEPRRDQRSGARLPFRGHDSQISVPEHNRMYKALKKLAVIKRSHARNKSEKQRQSGAGILGTARRHIARAGSCPHRCQSSRPPPDESAPPGRVRRRSFPAPRACTPRRAPCHSCGSKRPLPCRCVVRSS